MSDDNYYRLQQEIADLRSAHAAEISELKRLIEQQARCIHNSHASLMNASFDKCQSPYCFRARTALGGQS